MSYALLTIYADLLDDLERSRIATENRIRSLREVKGLAGSPEEERLDSISMGLADAERGATNELKKGGQGQPARRLDRRPAWGRREASRSPARSPGRSGLPPSPRDGRGNRAHRLPALELLRLRRCEASGSPPR